MATTMTAPVGNSISLANKYLPLLDELYKKDSVTTILDTDASLIRWDGANAIKIFKLNSNGLANYARNSGYVPGDVDGTWETLTLAQDRGRSFTVDAMDNDETVGMAFGKLLGENERVSVVPEVDAYRLAKYAMAAGNHSAATTIASNTNIADMIDEGSAVLDDAEVPYEGRILFVSPKCYKQLKGNITRYTYNGEDNVNYNVEMYNDMRVVTVPQGRFNTAITLNNPSAHDGDGGYVLAGAPINFIIVHPSAVMQVIKHKVPSIFAPSVNQEADAWKLNYRLYHDAFVLDNKKNGIYLCAAIPSSAMAASSSSVTSAGDVTISNALGTITAVSTDTTVATVVAGESKVTITKVANGTCKIKVGDGIGQSLEISVTFS